MAEAKSKAAPKAADKSTDHKEGPTGSEARERGYYGQETHIPNERYILTSDDKPHPNEEMHVAKLANGSDDAENIGG